MCPTGAALAAGETPAAGRVSRAEPAGDLHAIWRARPKAISAMFSSTRSAISYCAKHIIDRGRFYQIWRGVIFVAM